METKFTKGEWTLSSEKWGCVQLENGNFIAAYCPKKDGLYQPEDIEEARANAKLISAAPDLLEALQNLMGIMDTPIARRKSNGDSFYKEAIESAYSAINKAL